MRLIIKKRAMQTVI